MAEPTVIFPKFLILWFPVPKANIPTAFSPVSSISPVESFTISLEPSGLSKFIPIVFLELEIIFLLLYSPPVKDEYAPVASAL